MVFIWVLFKHMHHYFIRQVFGEWQWVLDYRYKQGVARAGEEVERLTEEAHR